MTFKIGDKVLSKTDGEVSTVLLTHNYGVVTDNGDELCLYHVEELQHYIEPNVVTDAIKNINERLGKLENAQGKLAKKQVKEIEI